MMREVGVCVMAVLLGSAFGGGVLAAEEQAPNVEEAERLYNEALAVLVTGKQAEGIALLEKAYVALPNPDFLFTIAVVYDQWEGHCAEALATFERFFAACTVCDSAPLARKRLEAVDARCKHAAAEPERAKAVAVTPTRSKPETPLVDTTAPEVEATIWTLDTLGWMSLGAGVLAVGTGAIFTARTLEDLDAEKAARGTPGAGATAVNELRDDTRRDALIANVAFITGALAVGGAIALFVMDGSDSKPPLEPVVGPNALGLAVSF